MSRPAGRICKLLGHDRTMRARLDRRTSTNENSGRPRRRQRAAALGARSKLISLPPQA